MKTLREIRTENEVLFNVLEAFFFDYDRDTYNADRTCYEACLDDIHVEQTTDSVYHYADIECGLKHEEFDFTIALDEERKEYIFTVFNNNFDAVNYIMFIDSETLKFKRSIDLFTPYI
jgi:hypothetical protein